VRDKIADLPIMVPIMHVSGTIGGVMTKKQGTELVPMARAVPAVGGGLDVVGVWLSGRNPRTLAAYDRDLRDFARFAGVVDSRSAVATLLALGQGQANAMVLMYRSHMTERGLATATVCRRLAAVRSVVKLARTMGVVSWSLDVESPKVQAYRDTAGPGDVGWLKLLAVAEAAAEATELGIRDRAILRLLRGLGLRRSELVALDLVDVELGMARLWILGKGRTQKEPLTIPARAVVALAAWLEVRGLSPGPLFWRLDRAAGDGGQRLTDKSVYLLVRRLGRRAGLARELSPHQLRHLAITQALDRSSGDTRAAQRFSRHADPRTLARYDDNRTDLAGKMARLVDED
jgi:integrase/recombinase XerC